MQLIFYRSKFRCFRGRSDFRAQKSARLMMTMVTAHSWYPCMVSGALCLMFCINAIRTVGSGREGLIEKLGCFF